MKQGWEIKKLGEVCLVISGQSPESECYNTQGNGMPFYQGKKEFTDRYIGNPTTWTTDITKIAKPLDVLMSVRAPVGDVNYTTEEICIGRGLAAIRVGKSLNNDYLFYYLLSIQDKINGKEGAVFPSINRKDIESLNIPICHFSEQERIVGILDSAFAKIEALRANTQQNLQNTKDLFQASIEDEFSIKDGWRSLRLNSIADVISGYAFKSGEFLNNGKFQVIRIGNVKQDFLRLTESPIFIEMVDEKTLNKSILRRGDLVITQTGTKKKRDYGFVALIDCDNLLLNQRVACVRFSRKEVNPRYLLYYSYTERYKNDFFAQEGGAVGQGNVGLTTIKELDIPFPSSSEEQTIIVEKLNALNERCRAMEENYRQTIAHCNALKQALLTKAFNGEL